MESNELAALVMRWIHILCAVAVGGSILFHWIVLRPAAAKSLSAEQHEALREALMKRWKMIIHPSILLFLVSGFYNFMMVTAPLHKGQGEYHMLFGIKFLLAIGVFAMAIVLTSTRKWSEKWRQGAAGWMVLALLVVATIMVGGYMKRMPTASPEAPAEVSESK